MSQQWYLPFGYKPSPPSGNYFLWSCCIPWPNHDYKTLWPEPVENYHFVMSFGTTKPRRKFSAEAKARIRMQRLRRRITRKYPLFAEQYIADEVASKPEYFDPVSIAEFDKTHAEYMKKLDRKYDMFFAVK